MPEGFPPTLLTFFEPEMLSANFGDLLNWCDCLFSAVVVLPEEAKEVKIATRQQAHSISWFEYRAGRITASQFKASVRTDISQPSSSLVSAICYPEAYKFTTSATRWDCSHEKEAIAQYTESVVTGHVNFIISDSGLGIRPDFAFLGDTLDACIKCSCWGAGIVEAKCPFGCHDALLTLESYVWRRMARSFSWRNHMHIITKCSFSCLSVRWGTVILLFSKFQKTFYNSLSFWLRFFY